MKKEKQNYLELIKKKNYSIIGNHSAVKTCLWLKKSLYNDGSCYKSKFYGIISHRCIQMTPSVICNQKCIFCWRPIELDLDTKNKIIWNEPEFIANQSFLSQKKLITGFGGSLKTNIEKYNESKNPFSVAISLIGEPTLYPYLDELILNYKKKNIITFIVSNGTNPNMIEKIKPDYLYLSLDAPNEKLYNYICAPNNKKLWKNINDSLNILKLKKLSVKNTIIRITVLRNYNYNKAYEFSKLINVALPRFIEIKSYMHIGYSRYRIQRDNMLNINELISFSNIICKTTNNYKIINISEISRVVLLSIIN